LFDFMMHPSCIRTRLREARYREDGARGVPALSAARLSLMPAEINIRKSKHFRALDGSYAVAACGAPRRFSGY
jgi:hypothetical protein